ncbi:MAG: prolipoprotein diacylglyceryl transferase [Bdellovibrionales bacterium]|nr:prolipoprotein diacylglyceryl transferase [Bdellovibrionales bacterium]
MDVYVHNLDPFFIHFWGDFGIRWYGLAYLTGFIAGLVYVAKMAPRGAGIGLSIDKLTDFTTWMAIGTLAGGRLGYAVFYSPDLLTDFSNQFPFWGVLAVHKGGMASHGGIVGIIIATVLYSRIHKVPILHLMDLTCAGGALGIFLGRIANFINGELFGRVVQSAIPWAVKFPSEMYLWTSQKVSELYKIEPAVKALKEVELYPPQMSFFTEFLLRIKSLFSGVSFPKGEMVSVTPEMWKEWVSNYRYDSMAYHGVNRVVESLIQAIQNGNQQVTEALAPFLSARHPSQLYESFMEGFLVFVVVCIVWRKPRRPGVVSVFFGLTYLVVRIIGEQFRMPDVQIGYQALGLTRGQWLSIAYFAILAVIFYISKKQNLPKMGGWTKETQTDS